MCVGIAAVYYLLRRPPLAAAAAAKMVMIMGMVVVRGQPRTGGCRVQAAGVNTQQYTNQKVSYTRMYIHSLIIDRL